MSTLGGSVATPPIAGMDVMTSLRGLIQLRTLKDLNESEAMEKQQGRDDLRRSLEEILKLCLKTARRLRAVLGDGAQRELATNGAEPDGSRPDEGDEPR